MPHNFDVDVVIYAILMWTLVLFELDMEIKEQGDMIPYFFIEY
jgi:hypothetical protein